jgi:pimeloyl-ACP methyl ester carboxylesterase
MLKSKAACAVLGILLLATGTLLTFHASRRYTEKRYIVDAGTCRLDVMSTERADLSPAQEHDYVLLFHGVSANKIVMEYLARSFAEMGMHVYTPDFPGHGRSPGRFTPDQAVSCSLSLARGLAARGMIYPQHTILVGHSMGGAVAMLVAEKFRPAAVIAISPAPMVAANGVADIDLLFHQKANLTPNTLIMVGDLEPKWLTANAQELVSGSPQPAVKFERVKWNSHVTVLFSRAVVREARNWAARALNRTDTAKDWAFPSRANAVGAALGFLGILLLAGPFLYEMVGKEPQEEARPANLPSALMMIFECGVASLVAILILRFWVPLRFLHLFEGDYLASFFLIVGAVLLVLHYRLARAQFPVKAPFLLGAAFSALVLHFLVTGWFELTLTGMWMTAQRWARFPAVFLAAFVFFCALESLLGPATLARQRILQALLLIATCWLVLAAGVVYFNSGMFLLVLLAGYFAFAFLFAYLGAQLVRKLTASATAAAVFGAILVAGFCLALFPLS